MLPRVGVLGAGDDLDERGLAGTVLAQQGVDLAAVDDQVDTWSSAWTPG